jgi:hypothetical protein
MKQLVIGVATLATGAVGLVGPRAADADTGDSAAGQQTSGQQTARLQTARLQAAGVRIGGEQAGGGQVQGEDYGQLGPAFTNRTSPVTWNADGRYYWHY